VFKSKFNCEFNKLKGNVNGLLQSLLVRLRRFLQTNKYLHYQKATGFKYGGICLWSRPRREARPKKISN